MHAYEVVLDGSEARDGAIALRPGENLRTGLRDFEDRYGQATSLEKDLLLLAAAILAVDRGTPRGERERLARRMSLRVPLVNVARLSALRPEIELVLRELSNDSWMVELPPREGSLEPDATWGKERGKVLLFSGGLDSLAAAIRISEDEEPPTLVSHVTMNVRTREAQEALVQGLQQVGHDCPHMQFFVSSRTDEDQAFDHDVETSQRTRSFLFLMLGALVARRDGRQRLVILAENGQMAIHLPLSSARVGAFSTHTAFPDVLVLMQRFLSTALEHDITITNPFVHETKAEVIRRIVEQCPELLAQSESCWKNSRLKPPATHCGECIPCYIRRIAIEANGIVDETAYANDPWRQPPPELVKDDVGWRNLVDLVEFVYQFHNLNDAEIIDQWPELYSEHVHAAEVISMYRRFSAEARGVFSQYPTISELAK